MGIQPEKERERRDNTGKPVFPGTGPTLYFSGKLFIHRDQWIIQSHAGSTGLTFIKTRHSLCMHTKVLGGFTSSSGQGPANILWPFLSDNSQSTRKLIFSRGDFS